MQLNKGLSLQRLQFNRYEFEGVVYAENVIFFNVSSMLKTL